MAYPSSYYVYCPPIQTYFVDKDSGEPLSAGYVTFYSDVNRTVLKTVYEQVQLSDNTYNFVALENPVTLSSTGTFADADGNDINVYFYPYENEPSDADTGALELYYLTVHSSGDVLQETREAWPPNAVNGANEVISFTPTANELANPQFVDISYIPDPTTNTYSYVLGAETVEIEIAPGWTLVATADTSGTLTVIQEATVGTDTPSNPPYVLDIDSTGLSSIYLRQRLTASPRILYGGSNGENGIAAISAYFVARSISPAASTQFIMTYAPDTGTSEELINSLSNDSNTFKEFEATTAIDGTANTSEAPAGYVDITVSWTANVNIQISSLQIVGVQNSDSSVEFIQQSSSMQENGLAYYYKPKLAYKPIPSYTKGWNFKYNPSQELGFTIGTEALAADEARYICDQTISFESVAEVMSYSISDAGLGFSCTTGTQFALIQYLPASDAYELLSADTLAVQIKGNSDSPYLDGYISLWWTTNTALPNVPISTNHEVFFSSLTTGIPTTPAANWNLVPNKYGAVASGANTNCVPFKLNGTTSMTGWDNSAITASNAKFFAIVISFESIPITAVSYIEYCTLVLGDIATAPPPTSTAQELTTLEQYYETSYDLGAVPGTSSPSGALESRMTAYTNGGGNAEWGANSFGIRYNEIKRTTPTVSINTPLGVADNARAAVYVAGAVSGTAADASMATYWSAANSGDKGITYDSISAGTVTTGSGATPPISANITYHFVADARLGEVT